MITLFANRERDNGMTTDMHIYHWIPSGDKNQSVSSLAFSSSASIIDLIIEKWINNRQRERERKEYFSIC